MTSVKGAERTENRRISRLQATICDRLTHQFPSALVSETPSIKDLIPSDGVAHLQGGQVVKYGSCLSDKQILELVAWAKERINSDDIFYTTSLAEDGFSVIKDWTDVICGVLVAPVLDTDVFVWFRKRLQVAPKWAWTDAAAGGSSSLERKKILYEARSVHWTHGELAGVKGLQRLAQETLNGNSEPMKTMMLVRLNEERLRAMQDLAMVARDLGRMMEISKTPIMGISKEMAITEWNKRMAELTGRPKASVIGKGLAEILIPQNIEVTRLKLEKAMKGKAQDHVELMLKCTAKLPPNQQNTTGKGKTADGENEVGTMVLMATMTPQWDSTNEVIGVSIIGQDITEQKQMMKRFEDGVATDYKQMLDKATMPIWGVDKEGRIVEWNNAMAKTSGISKDQAMGKSLVGELVGLEKRLMVPERDMLLSLEFAIERALAGHETPLVGFNFVNDEGKSVDSVLNIQLRKEDSLNSTQVMCFMEDVTMRRAMEKAMAVRLAAEAAADAKTRHLAFLCHEIRNPLNGILGNISFMEDTTLSEEQKELVQTTSTCGYQLRKIVEDVLDINSIEGGKVVLECAELHLQRIVNAVISQVGLAASKKGLQLYSRVGARCRNFKPLGDAPRLQQVLSNFAWNAVKFTQQGWVELSVGMEEPQPPHSDGKQFARFHFQVADSGEGIPDSLRLRLFEEFSTGRKTASSQYGGTGLGLSICQQLASLMGGDIRCQSEVGKGSTFSLDVDLQILPLSLKESSSGVAKQISETRKEHTSFSDSENDIQDGSEEEIGQTLDNLAGDKGASQVKKKENIADKTKIVPSKEGGETKAQNSTSSKTSSLGNNQQATQLRRLGVYTNSPDSLSPMKGRLVETPSQVSEGGMEVSSDIKRNAQLPRKSDVKLISKSEFPKAAILATEPVSQAQNMVTRSSERQQREASEVRTNAGKLAAGHNPHTGIEARAGKNEVEQSAAHASRYTNPSSLKVMEVERGENRPRFAASGPQQCEKDNFPCSIDRKTPGTMFQKVPQSNYTLLSQMGNSTNLAASSGSLKRTSSLQTGKVESRCSSTGQQEQLFWAKRNGGDPLQEQAAAIAKLTDMYGDDWSFKVVREHLSSDAVAVLAEVIIPGTVRQQWGSVPCEGMSPVLLFPAATAKALQEVAALFRQNTGGKKPGLPYSGSLWAGRFSRDPSLSALNGANPGTDPNKALSRTSSADVHSGGMTALSSNSGSKIGSPRVTSMAANRQQVSGAANKLLGALRQHSRKVSSNASSTSLSLPISPYPPTTLETDAIPQLAGKQSTLLTVGTSLNPIITTTPTQTTPIVLPGSLGPANPSPPVILSADQQSLSAPSSKDDMQGSSKNLGIHVESKLHTQNPRCVETGGKELQHNKETRPQRPDPLVSPKVLIIDDEPVNILVVKRALDRASFQVVTGSDGTDVVEMVVNKRQCFDALLLDERLKVMNGSEACMLVREFEISNGLPEMPIIAISANVEPDDVKRYAIAGYSAVMGKPINVRTVGERLRKFLASYKQLPPARRIELKRGEPVKVKKHEDIILFS